jgi:predicted nucleotidyltransferase
MRSDFGLDERALALLRSVFSRYAAISEVKIFGSRAKGNFRPESDVDLALCGDEVDERLAGRIAGELDELPLPYRFDVQADQQLSYRPLREHIDRVGRVLYRRAPDCRRP